MSWLELLEFVEALPADSATSAALAGDTKGRRWTDRDWMAAYQANLLQMLIRIQWAAGGIKGTPDLHTVPVPELVHEPSEADLHKAALLQEMARHRPRNRGQGDLAVLDAALKARRGTTNP
jgi:hypothetical protein